jgi:thioredoxin reductase/pSer/pThr/pTyr-binding forkhead associated (FHA) protein/ferredoxin
MADAPVKETFPDGTFIVDKPVTLPDLLDVVIVGGGPFGTAAAFRAKELGLSALVIDHDDLMRRIRDYAKGKEILPDYGGGDRMQFPDGGPLTRGLWFEPIDKDAMCVRWKGLYRQHNVPAQVGVEMLGVERNGQTWHVKCWNHNTKADQVYKAKHVILAMGRGVPRRIDIAGDLRGMAFSFKDATGYLGQPALVIGGGTSAAEAVIAISNAKAAAGETAAVYWSYRADKMPKVSKALAEVFFEAFVINGNVRYLPSSEPVAIVGDGPQARLALRTARKEAAGQPTETLHLEFDKTFCVACIGEDIPEQLLAGVGCPLVTGGPQNKKRIIVSPLLETRQPDIYLAGDVLSPAYFETANFDSDPAGFPEVKRRGNVKAAMRDGVFLAEVIAQKLAGKSEIRVDLKFADAPSRPAAATPDAEVTPAVAAAPAAAPSAPAAVKPLAPKGDHLLVSILPTGVEANEFSLRPSGATTIGRAGSDIVFPDDAALSDRHAVVDAGPDGYRVRPEGGARGLYLLPATDRVVPLEPGMLIHAGRQWFVAGDRHDPASLIHYEASGQAPRRYALKDGPTIVGRESPDLTVAPNDGALSRRHFVVIRKGDALSLKDLGSANGTLIQIDRPVTLVHGDCLVLGQQKLKFSDERAAERPKATVRFDSAALHAMAHAVTGVVQVPVTPRAAASAPAAAPSPARAPVPAAAPAPAPGAASAPAAGPAAAPAAAAASGPSVTFQKLGKVAACPKGKSICEAAEAAHIKLDADCHQGVCGMDPVRVISGGEFLSPMSDAEKGTLEDLCSLKPGEHRLACMARVSGPVVVDPIKQ